jgi:hypothetical protein
LAAGPEASTLLFREPFVYYFEIQRVERLLEMVEKGGRWNLKCVVESEFSQHR